MAKFLLLLALALVAVPVFGGVSRNVVYFPDPKHEGKLIPAFLDGPSYMGSMAENVTIKTRFYLLTRNNPDEADELFIDDMEALESSNFVKGAPLKVMCHGFGGSPQYVFPQELAHAFLEQGPDVNVVLLDWTELSADPWYNIAAGAANSVGRRAGELVQFLIDVGYVTIDDVHIIGYSLGCHVAGACGAQLKGEAPRVTALDPALPLFDIVGDDERIDPSDGQFVDVVHTAGGYLWENGLAFITPRGDADFYPNSGRHQPGCEGLPEDTFGSCSHSRAPAFFTESVTTTTGFFGCLCESYELYIAGGCDCSDLVEMGINTPSTANGSYWFQTAASMPYALGEAGALPNSGN